MQHDSSLSDVAKKRLGKEGEQVASAYLKRLGYRVLEKNFRCRSGEIDLIVEKGEELLFVEVKSRRSTDDVSPLELVPYPKQRHISQVAQYYFMKKRIEEKQGSFAMVVVDYSESSPRCELLTDIFDLAWGY